MKIICTTNPLSFVSVIIQVKSISDVSTSESLMTVICKLLEATMSLLSYSVMGSICLGKITVISPFMVTDLIEGVQTTTSWMFPLMSTNEADWPYS